MTLDFSNPGRREHPHNLTQSQQSRVIELALEGLDGKDIARDLGMKTSLQVNTFLRRYLAERPEVYEQVMEARRKWDRFGDETQAGILEIALSEGLSSIDIAERLKLPQAKVSSFLKEHFRDNPQDQENYEQRRETGRLERRTERLASELRDKEGEGPQTAQ